MKINLTDLALPQNLDVTGGFEEIKVTYRQSSVWKAPAGVVIDGCIRDFPIVKRDLDIGLWLRGVSPNFHTQTNVYPYAVNVPIGMNDTLVMPGDIIVADDQRDRIFERIYFAAKLDTPGMGLAYITRLEKVATYVPPDVAQRIRSEQER